MRRRTLWYVEPLIAARTPLADFSSIMLVWVTYLILKLMPLNGTHVTEAIDDDEPETLSSHSTRFSDTFGVGESSRTDRQARP